jgi:hypothetical protein
LGAPISISHTNTLFSGLITGGYQCNPVPWIVGIQPTVEGPTSLFVVRPEVAGDGDDLDLYCHRVQNVGAAGSWIVNATWECRAPNADLPDVNGCIADQFCQAAEIDRWGRLHILYYDNSSTMTVAGELTGDYDVWHLMVPNPTLAPPTSPYMMSTNLRITPAIEDPPLVAVNAQPGASPKEYSAIDSYYDSVGGKVVLWCLYAGTSISDEDSDKTVVFGTRITILD